MTIKKTVTPSLEDYLETIYFLYEEKGDVRVTDVALSMDLSKPSVNKAIKVLKEMGYVNHEHYGLLHLTQEGIGMAKKIAKKHFVIKQFLTGLLDIDEELAEAEACRIEHQMSELTVDKLEQYLKKVLD